MISQMMQVISYFQKDKKLSLQKSLQRLNTTQDLPISEMQNYGSHYSIEGIIGQGRFGIVKLARDLTNKNKLYVLKLYDKIKLIRANVMKLVQVGVSLTTERNIDSERIQRPSQRNQNCP